MLRSDNRHRDSYLRPTERYQCRPARRLSLVCLNWLAHYPEPRAGTSDPALDRPHRALADRSRFLVGEARRHGLLRARSTPLPNKPAAGLIVRWLNCLDVDVGQTPAQCCRDDQNHGDHAEVSGLLSSRRMLPHFSIHLELSLKLLRHNLQPMLLARPSAV